MTPEREANATRLNMKPLSDLHLLPDSKTNILRNEIYARRRRRWGGGARFHLAIFKKSSLKKNKEIYQILTLNILNKPSIFEYRNTELLANLQKCSETA